MADVQIAVIDPEDTQLALAAPAEAVVNVAVPGVQGPIGSVAIAQDGTATEPGIRFESDTNTGIYRPGADQLAISTGGTGRLFVDASGDVGVGVNPAGYKLRVAGVSLLGGNVAVGTADTANCSLSIGSLATGNRIAFLDLIGDTSGYGVRVQRDNGGVNTNSYFIHRGTGEFRLWGLEAGSTTFYTNNTERARIDSSGRLGIGTSSPGALLHVATASGTASELRIATGGASSTATLRIGQVGAAFWDQQITTTSGNYLLKIDGGGDAYRVERAGTAVNTHIFSTAGSERARIDSSGRVGIGTSSPDALLTVNGVGAHGLGTAAAPSFAFTGDLNTGIYSPGADQLAISTGGTERMRLDSSGRLGLGTSSPGGRLTVRSDRAIETYAAVFGTTNGVTFENDFVFSFNGTAQNIGNFQNFPLAFFTNNTERARIDSSGRLLVGTSTNITDASNGVRAIQSAGSGPSIGTHRNDNTIFGSGLLITKARGTAFEVLQANDTIGLVRFDGANGTSFNIAAEIQCQVDGIPGADDMPGRLVFFTTADGGATPTERLRITSAGVLQVADAGNITVGTTTGTKIGTATTQKLGFYDATPVVQPTAVADATDAASVITQLNALLTRMRNLGLIAT